MNINKDYRAEPGILYVRIDGELILEEYEQCLREIVESAEYPSDVKTLWDLRTTNFSPLNAQFGERLLAIREKYPERGNAKVAFVAEQDLAFGLSRMYEMMSSGMPQHIMVFRDMQSAGQWLEQVE